MCHLNLKGAELIMAEVVADMETLVGLLRRLPVEIDYQYKGTHWVDTKVVVDGMFRVTIHGLVVVDLDRFVVGWWNQGLSVAVDGSVLKHELHEAQHVTVPGCKICLRRRCFR
jgi:hypothetical protein